MDFDLTDEQRLLKDSVDRLIADQYQFEQRKKYMAEPDGWSRDVWKQYAELGLLGLPFAEKHGGFGGGAVETMIVMEAFGRGLVLEPYFATVILGGGLLRRAGTPAQQQALMPRDRAGQAEARLRACRTAVALRPRRCRHHRAAGRRGLGAGRRQERRAARRLRRSAAGDRARLRRPARSHGHRPVPGRSVRGRRDRGAAIRRRTGCVPPKLRFRACALRADDVLGDAGAALPAIEHVVDEAIAALCAEAVGTMQAMHETTLEYLKTRQQFGRPIGQFQVLQHRSVDMLVALEQARSMAMFAAVMAAEEDATERRRAMAAAKVQIGRSGRHIGQEAIQLHGGIGMTMEYKVGHYFKRMTMIDMLFGDADTHLATLARLGGLFGNVRAA